MIYIFAHPTQSHRGNVISAESVMRGIGCLNVVASGVLMLIC